MVGGRGHLLSEQDFLFDLIQIAKLVTTLELFSKHSILLSDFIRNQSFDFVEVLAFKFLQVAFIEGHLSDKLSSIGQAVRVCVSVLLNLNAKLSSEYLFYVEAKVISLTQVTRQRRLHMRFEFPPHKLLDLWLHVSALICYCIANHSLDDFFPQELASLGPSKQATSVSLRVVEVHPIIYDVGNLLL